MAFRARVKIERWGDDRIAAVIPYSLGKDAHKRVPGSIAVWDKTVYPERFRFWSYPLGMHTCRRFREEFGDDLDIGPELWAWAQGSRTTERSLETLRAGGADVDLPTVRADAPNLWQALLARPYQIEGAAFAVQGQNVCIGDEPRLGKTYQALAAAVESRAEAVLIVAPRTAIRSVWFRKIDELIGEEAFVAQGDRAARVHVINQFHATPGPRFLIINKEMMRIKRMYRCKVREDEADSWVKVEGHRNPVPVIKGVTGWPERQARPNHKGGCYKSHRHDTVEYPEFPDLFRAAFDMIILDESHHALATTKHLISGGISQMRLGAMKLPVHSKTLKLAMSGTPFRSSNLKAWGVLNWLRPDIFTSFWRFAEEHWGVTETGYQGARVIGKKIKDMEKFRNMLRPYYLARTKAQVAPHLKPIEYAGTPPPGHPDGPVGVYLDMLTESGSPTRQARAYRDMETMGLATLRGGKRLTANGVLAELTRLKQFSSAYGTWRMDQFYPDAPSVKLDWILEFLQEREALDGKVVIASQFTKFVKFYAKHIRAAGWKVLTLTGETTDQRRLDVQDIFQNDPDVRVIIINMFAGGEAIDLSAADEIILTDEPWSAHIIEQTENRIQSLAKRNQLTVYRLRAAGTIEQDIATMTSEQLAALLAGKPEALDELIEARDARIREAA